MVRLKDRKSLAVQANCSICRSRQPGKVELYQFRDELDTYVFRNDKAKELVSDGREAGQIGAMSLRHLLAMNAFDELHLGHVDVTKPGICTRRFGGLILLDGVHRAVCCLAHNQRFLAFELTYEESLVCLVQQKIATRDAATIVRKLRRALKYFPRADSLDTPIECSSKVLDEVIRQMTAQELKLFNLRAVPNPT